MYSTKEEIMKNKSLESIFGKINKALAMVLLSVILALIPCSVLNAAAVGTVLSNSVERQTITSGIIHKTVKRFTSEGWLSIHILQVDLKNPNIGFKVLTNTTNSTKLTNVKALADAGSVIAAVNANYFYSVGNGNANALGPAISDGKIVDISDGFNQESDTMATFSLDSSGMPAIDYWKTDLSITSPETGATGNVSSVNRLSSYYFKDIIILDRKYGEMSLGVSEEYPDLLEMVVSDGVVSEIRIGQPAVKIPENGYVAVTRASDTNFIVQNFKVGSPVRIDVKSSIDWQNIDLAVSGSSVILKDGIVPSEFSFKDSNNNVRNPRTLIGSTKDAKTLYIVTVDGRQKASIGMTLKEAADYMLELGVYNALNLDGGGSTTMVSRPLGDHSLTLANTPSDGGMRGVTTALGIISAAPISQLEGLVIDVEDSNVFVNTSRKLTVKGYDKYFNPIEIKPADIKWSMTGLNGTVKKNEKEPSAVFTPKEVGLAKLTATIGKVKKTVEIYSLSSPVRLELDRTSITAPIGTETPITVTGYNINGYAALLDPSGVSFKTAGILPQGGKKAPKIGSVNAQGIFVPEESGTGYIDAAVGKVHAYCSVSVLHTAYVFKDTFESETNRSFTSYPADTEGSYTISKDFAYNNLSSAKLSYNFLDLPVSRAVYMNYADKGIEVDPGYEYIGVHAYIPATNEAVSNAANQVKLDVTDGNGKSHLLSLAEKMDWTGWKYLQASISDLKSPVQINRLYVVRIDAGAARGDIYFDELLIKKNWYDPIDKKAIPADTAPKDTANVPGVKFKASSTSFRFAFFGQSAEPSTDIQKTLIKKMTARVKNLETYAVAGNSAHAFTKGLKKLYVSAYKGFKSYTLKNSQFIQLDMNTGSMRTSGPEQWIELQKLLDTTKSKNVFLFLAKSPNEMSDKLEAKLLKDILTNFKLSKSRNVWVFYNGPENKTYMERGVRYVSSCGYSVEGLNSKTISSAKYYQVTVNGGTVTYELKSMNS